MKKAMIYEYVFYLISYMIVISLFFKQFELMINISYIIIFFEILILFLYIRAKQNKHYLFIILSILFVLTNGNLKYLNVIILNIFSIFNIIYSLKYDKRRFYFLMLSLLSIVSLYFLKFENRIILFTLIIADILFHIGIYFIIKNLINEYLSIKRELKYVNSKKNIFDYSPFSVNRDNILNNKEKSIRMIEQISDSVKSIIEVIYKTISVQSVGYLLYDNKNELLYTEHFKSSYKIHKNKPLNIKENILYYSINNNEGIMNNMYLSDPEQLGIYNDNVIIRSMIVIPIKKENSVYGLLYLDSSQENRFNVEEYELVNMYASQIGKLLTFGFYAQQSKRDATYFSVINEIVHKMAKTLDYSEILESINYELKKIFQNINMLVIRKNGDNCHILYQSDNIYKQKHIIKQENTVIDIIDNNKDFLFLNNLQTRKFPLHILNKKENINKSSIIGFKLIRNNDEYTDYMILFSSEIIQKDSTMTGIMRFLIDAITTAIEKANYYEQMRNLAIKDGLTGVYNHRYFQEQLDFFMEQAKRNNNQLALIIMDIDYFKKFNDTYGHQIGDLVLKKVASTISNSIRTTDFIARYGGEEFAIILNNIQRNSIFETIDKLRITIEQLPFKHKDQILKITASFGVSIFPEHTEDKTLLIKYADEALYVAKESGRNRVCIHSLNNT